MCALSDSLLLRDRRLYRGALSLLQQQLQVIAGELQQLSEGSGLRSWRMAANILLIVHRLHHLRQRHLEGYNRHLRTQTHIESEGNIIEYLWV